KERTVSASLEGRSPAKRAWGLQRAALVPPVWIEQTTCRLQGGCSATELRRRRSGLYATAPIFLIDDGPGNEQDNHHRRGVFVVDGQAGISRRYAIDWEQSVDGVFFSGDPLDNRSHYAYGKPVLAVADATVVVARDGFPDNVPRYKGQFHTAVPIAMETALGIA